MKITKQKLEELKNVNLGRIMDFSEMIEPYEDYIKKISENKVFFGFDTLDNHLFGMRPPELCSVLSEPDIGKTTFILNLLRYQIESNSFLKNKLIINFSLELNEYDLIERVIQMETGLNSFEIEKKFKTDMAFKEKCCNLVNKYDNIVSVMQRIKVCDIIPYIKAVEEMKSLSTGLIIIDYLQLVTSEFSDDYLRTTRAMQGIKEASLLLNLPIIVTSQVSRSAGKNIDGLELTSGKSSGAIEETSQIVLGLEKIRENDKNDIDFETLEKITKGELRLLRLKILKKKRGQYLNKPLYLNLDYKNLKLAEYEKR